MEDMSDSGSVDVVRSPVRARWLFRAAVCLWAMWLIGQAARDRTWLTGLLFYIPSPAVAVLFFALALRSWRRKGLCSALLCVFLALVPTVLVIFVENRPIRSSATVEEAASTRLVHWNVFGGGLGWKRVEAILQPTSTCFRKYPATSLAGRWPMPWGGITGMFAWAGWRLLAGAAFGRVGGL